MGNTNKREKNTNTYDENDKYRDGFIVLWGGLLQIQTEIQMMKITNTGGCIVGPGWPWERRHFSCAPPVLVKPASLHLQYTHVASSSSSASLASSSMCIALNVLSASERVILV